MKRKKMFIITVLLLITFTTSACNITKKDSVPVPVEIHLQISGLESNSNDPLLKQQNQLYLHAAANFHKINPQITVIIDYTTGNNFSIQDTLKSNESPDIMDLDINSLQPAERERLLLDLLPLQQSSGSKEIDINQQILDSATTNGKLFILPYSADPWIVLYSKDIFDAAHIPYPQGDWTWEQFRDISKKIKPQQGSVLPYDISTFGLLMGSTGKGLLSSDGKTSVGYLDSPEAIRTLQWLNDYYHDDKLKTPPMNLGDLFQSGNLQTGMIIFTYASKIIVGGKVLDFRDKSSKVGVAPLPHFEGGKRANLIRLSGFGISQKSKHPEAAWKFIEYLTLTKNETTNKLGDYYLTTSKSMADATGQKTDPIKSIYLDELKYAVEPSEYYNPLFNQAWNEDLTAQFRKLLTTDDKDIPAKLHDLALKLDQEMNHLKNAEVQQAESPSP